jgi:HEAT repeat protein
MRVAAVLLLLGCIAAAGGWWVRSGRLPAFTKSPAVATRVNWLDHISSPNPSVAEEARRKLKNQGIKALPEILETLRNPTAPEDRKKAALRGCAVLGPDAAPALNEAAAHLTIPGLAVDAAVALSFMGYDAFGPLRDALASEDPVVRRESLRAIGKLHERASLEPDVIVPLLLDGLADADAGVRVVSATYLGIIHTDGPEVVPELIEVLQDEDAEVRTAAATALGSFGADADIAVEALKRARGDKDEDVAREAGVSLVKLNKEEEHSPPQQQSRR